MASSTPLTRSDKRIRLTVIKYNMSKGNKWSRVGKTRIFFILFYFQTWTDPVLWWCVFLSFDILDTKSILNLAISQEIQEIAPKTGRVLSLGVISPPPFSLLPSRSSARIERTTKTTTSCIYRRHPRIASCRRFILVCSSSSFHFFFFFFPLVEL